MFTVTLRAPAKSGPVNHVLGSFETVIVGSYGVAATSRDDGRKRLIADVRIVEGCTTFIVDGPNGEEWHFYEVHVDLIQSPPPKGLPARRRARKPRSIE